MNKAIDEERDGETFGAGIRACSQLSQTPTTVPVRGILDSQPPSPPRVHSRSTRFNTLHFRIDARCTPYPTFLKMRREEEGRGSVCIKQWSQVTRVGHSFTL